MTFKMCKCSSSGTSSEIVNQLASDKKLMAELMMIHNKDYTRDVIQDIFLQMLEKEPQEKLQRLCLENKMKFFIIGIMTRQINSTSSKTARKYKNNFDYDPQYLERNLQGEYENDGWPNRHLNKLLEIMIVGDVNPDWDLNLFNKTVEKELTKLHFYDRMIFEKVISSDKTFKELAEEIKIKEYNIFYCFNKVRRLLRKKLKKMTF